MDDSEMAQQALEYALENHPDAEITVLHVVGEPSPMMGKAAGLVLDDDMEETARTLAEPIFTRAREIADSYDADIETSFAVTFNRRELYLGVARGGVVEPVVPHLLELRPYHGAAIALAKLADTAWSRHQRKSWPWLVPGVRRGLHGGSETGPHISPPRSSW